MCYVIHHRLFRGPSDHHEVDECSTIKGRWFKKGQDCNHDCYYDGYHDGHQYDQEGMDDVQVGCFNLKKIMKYDFGPKYLGNV